MDILETNIIKPKCGCGCGQYVTKAKQTDNKRGIKKGQYTKFAKGHYLKRPSIEHGSLSDTFCACGCGKNTYIARLTTKDKGGSKRGMPELYLAGHLRKHKSNTYYQDEHDNNITYIKTKKGDITIDTTDVPKVIDYVWYIDGNGYARAAVKDIKGKKVSIHRLICGLSTENKLIVDHINRDKLDNRKSNLRVCNHKANQKNRGATSNKKFKGVYANNKECSNEYQASISLGSYQNEAIAAIAYDQIAYILYKEFAYLNFPILKRNYIRNDFFNLIEVKS